MAKRPTPPPDMIGGAELAALLGISFRWLGHLSAEGWIKKTDGYYTRDAGIKGYIAYLKSEIEKAKGGATQTAAQQARAKEIEQRMAIKARDLIPLEESYEATDMLAGFVRSSLEGFPARLTRDMALREYAEEQVNVLLNEIADKVREARQSLRQGGMDSEALEEADA